MTHDTKTLTRLLEPCPFCRKIDAFVERADYSSCYVVCNDCGARGPTSCNETDADCEAEEAGMEPGENAARRLWNAAAMRKAATLSDCPSCKGFGDDPLGCEACNDTGKVAATLSDEGLVERLQKAVRLFPTACDVLTRQEMKDAKGNWRSLIDQQTKALEDLDALSMGSSR